MSAKSISKLPLVFLLLVVFLLSGWSTAQTGCSQFNGSYGPYYGGHNGIDQHINGAHGAAFTVSGTCSYTGAAGQACAATSHAYALNPNYSDTGALKVLGYHVGHANAEDGIATSTGGLAATSNSIGGVVFENCLSSTCGFSVTFSGSGSGAGFSLNVPPAAVWSDKLPYTMLCAGKTAPPVGCTGNCGGPGSPVAVATGSTGFMQGFSDPQTDCVLFDLRGDGNPVCISWPKEDSGLAWLVLPDENGQVTSGLQLFGNYTPQANHQSPNPNGFLALAEYDMIQAGGNLDLVVDKQDAVWNGKRKLRLWFDKHCRQNPAAPCTALPGELRPLEAFGIENISLVYGQGPDPDTDQWNNQFKYCAHMNVKPEKLQDSPDGRLACDVWVQQKQ